MVLSSKNLSQLKKELKPLEGKAKFKMTRANSLHDGEFIKTLESVGAKSFTLSDGKQKGYVDFPPANKIEFIENGFKIRNLTFELLSVEGEVLS